VNPVFCEKMEVSHIQPGRPVVRVPQVGNRWTRHIGYLHV